MKRFKTFRFDIPTGLSETPGEGLTVTTSGKIAMVSDGETIRQSIMIILGTIPGERIMRPDFGCDLYKLVFSVNDDTTAGIAIHYVKRALSRWEKRIELVSVDAAQNSIRPDIMDIFVSYKIRSTQTDDQVTFHFDLMNEDGAGK